MKKVNIAIMGLGVVGGGTFDILKKSREHIQKTQGLDISVVKILEKDESKVFKRTCDASLFVSDILQIVNDKSISVVVETMGGVEPAKTFIKEALLAGKSVVTANKELLAKHWGELEAAARQGGAGLYFEASCGGTIPIIRTLTESIQGDNVEEIMGIINGTTNYILTKMSQKNMDYSSALLEAQQKGFAESDPTSDVGGFDAVYKLSILSSLAFHTHIPYLKIYREGIESISKRDIQIGKDLGYALKLLAIGKKQGNNIEVRVHPTFIPQEHPLASVQNEYNAVFLKGDNCDKIMLYGKGAGALPTGSAIVSDIVTCALKAEHSRRDFVDINNESNDLSIITDFNSKYYMAFTAADKPGVLAKVTEILGKNEVSINTVSQKGSSEFLDYVPIVFLTHITSENKIQNAIRCIKELKEIRSVDSLIRVI